MSIYDLTKHLKNYNIFVPWRKFNVHLISACTVGNFVYSPVMRDAYAEFVRRECDAAQTFPRGRGTYS